MSSNDHDNYFETLAAYFGSILSQGLSELWNILEQLIDTFRTAISSIFSKVRDILSELYDWIGQKVSYFFHNASKCAQDVFVAIISRVNRNIFSSESEADELLEASRKKNHQAKTPVDAAALHALLDGMKDADYANAIFKNAKNDSALQRGMKNKDSEDLHHVTSDLLSISNSLAKKLGKNTLKEVQDLFEALSEIVKEEFKNKIETYTKMLTAARAGTEYQVNLEVFNQSLGIEGDPKEHYWKEAMKSTMENRLAYGIKDKMSSLDEQKKNCMVELWTKAVDDIAGVYSFSGVNSAGKFTANDLIKSLKEIKVDLNEEKLVIDETSSVIVVRAEDLIIGAIQELNSENTSDAMVFIVRMSD